MKQYLLLRENSVSGPFTFADLIDMDLTQADLVWIENMSSCWIPANQIDELKSFVTIVDEELLLQKRQQQIMARQNAKMIQEELTSFPIIPGNSSGGNNIHVRYKAPYFPERSADDSLQKQIWKKADYPVANWVNVTLVFLTACLVAYVVSQLAG
jgi:hypothetical protein